MYAERLPPHDVDAEESLIGSVLIDGEALSRVTSFLKPHDIYSEKNRWCYQACVDLSERGEGINQVSVAHELSLQERLEGVGGPAYLSHLVQVVPTSVHIEHYARIIQRTSLMRQIIHAGGEIAAIGYDAGPDPDSALSRAEEALFKIRSGRGSRDFTHIRDVLDDYMAESGAMQVPDADHLAPVPTGFMDLDKLLGGGLQRSDMIVVAARPSMGKSTLAFNIAQHAASRGAFVGVFSLEMGSQQIGLRLLASEANIDSSRLRLGLVNDAEEKRLLDAIGALSDLPIYIDDTPIQGIVEMRGKARRLQSDHGLDMLVVDYLQLITNSSSSGWRSDNRVQEMGEISRSLKGLARDLDIPVLACSQLSRAPEQRPNHRPLLSDLRESGSIEQDADVVAFIYREDTYTTRDEWEKSRPTEPYPQNIAELLVQKHRNGPTGNIPLYFRDNIVKFESAHLQQRSREFA